MCYYKSVFSVSCSDWTDLPISGLIWCWKNTICRVPCTACEFQRVLCQLHVRLFSEEYRPAHSTKRPVNSSNSEAQIMSSVNFLDKALERFQVFPQALFTPLASGTHFSLEIATILNTMGYGMVVSGYAGSGRSGYKRSKDWWLHWKGGLLAYACHPALMCLYSMSWFCLPFFAERTDRLWQTACDSTLTTCNSVLWSRWCMPQT